MAVTKLFGGDTGDLSNIPYSDTAAAAGTTFKNQFTTEFQATDGHSGDTETTWIVDFNRWNGIYKTIPEYQAVINKLKSWVLGNGFEKGKDFDKTKSIKGWGKEDFLEIIKNQFRTCVMAGDSFAEIIRDKAGRMVNLKSMNAGSIKIVVNKAGLIIRYEQVSQITGKTLVVFQPKEIFHLCWNRIADEIHGIPLGEKLQKLINMRNENMQDQQVFFHRYAAPISIIPLDTDDEAEIAKIKAKHKEAYKKGEVMFVPKDTVDVSNIKNAIGDIPNLDPLPWLQYLIRQFVTGSDVPEVVMGWGEGTTEAGSKVVMLGWEHTAKEHQLWIENQIKNQLNLKLKLIKPPTIEPESPGSSTVKANSITEDAKKDGGIRKPLQ